MPRASAAHRPPPPPPLPPDGRYCCGRSGLSVRAAAAAARPPPPPPPLLPLPPDPRYCCGRARLSVRASAAAAAAMDRDGLPTKEMRDSDSAPPRRRLPREPDGSQQLTRSRRPTVVAEARRYSREYSRDGAETLGQRLSKYLMETHGDPVGAFWAETFGRQLLRGDARNLPGRDVCDRDGTDPVASDRRRRTSPVHERRDRSDELMELLPTRQTAQTCRRPSAHGRDV